jgi:hypothetical protein
MSIGLKIFTLFHVALSLIGIASGFVVTCGLLTARRLDRWTAVFLATTIATSATGFFFPVHHFTPAHAFGILSLLVLGPAVIARYRRALAGNWRWIYVLGVMIGFYFNFFILIVQAFRRVPALKALAPTQTEPPFKLTQLVALAAFAVLTILALIRFRTEPRHLDAPRSRSLAA